jgi:hypothetical protein
MFLFMSHSIPPYRCQSDHIATLALHRATVDGISNVPERQDNLVLAQKFKATGAAHLTGEPLAGDAGSR